MSDSFVVCWCDVHSFLSSFSFSVVLESRVEVGSHLLSVCLGLPKFESRAHVAFAPPRSAVGDSSRAGAFTARTRPASKPGTERE